MERKINIEAAKRLAKKYASITLEELEDLWFLGEIGSSVMYKITGFGSERSCCLCQEATLLSNEDHKCNCCIFGDGQDTLSCVYTPFWHDVSWAKCPEELFVALQNRSKFIINLVEKWENT